MRFALAAAVTVGLTACDGRDRIDWSSYAEDFDTLAELFPDGAECPFRLSGTAVKDTKNYRLALTFDRATIKLPGIRILVMPFAYSEPYQKSAPPMPFLGYGPEPIGLGPVQDSLAQLYPGLNLVFSAPTADYKVKISVKTATESYYTAFENFTLKEEQL